MKDFTKALKSLLKEYGMFSEESSKEVVDTLPEEEMVSFEVVYEPLVKDAHGQWMSQDTLIDACENFNTYLQKGVVKPNLFHLQDTESFSIVDTWIQKELDVIVEQTGEKIKAGTWIAKLKYNDPALWKLKKAGIVGGVSIGCMGLVNEDTGEITNVTFDGGQHSAS